MNLSTDIKFLDNIVSIWDETSRKEPAEVLECLSNVLISSYVPPIQDDHPVSADDFEDEPNRVLPGIRMALYAIQRLYDWSQQHSTSLSTSEAKKLFPSIVLLCSQHSDETFWWSSPELNELTQKVLGFLVQLCDKLSFEDCLCDLDSKYNVLLWTLHEVASCKLTKKDWKKYPAQVQGFKFIIRHIRYPVMGTYLSAVVPVSLIILDDFQLEHKMLGCELISYIFTTTTKADLQTFNYDTVIYKAVQPLLLQKEKELIIPVSECMIRILQVMTHHNDRIEKYGYADDVMKTLIQNLELEQNQSARNDIMSQMVKYVTFMGIAFCRHLKCCLQALKSVTYLSVSYCQILNLLHVVLETVWPVIPFHSEDVLEILWLVNYKLKKNNVPGDERERTQEVFNRCLKMIKELKPECFDYLNQKIPQCFDMYTCEQGAS